MTDISGAGGKLEADIIKRIYWRFIPLFFVLMFFNYLDRANVSFAALRMNKDIGLGPAEFGFAGSIFFLGYMALGIPSNILLYWGGARVWLCRILILWGAVATATAFIWNDISLYVLRFVLGVAESGFLPGLAFFVTLWFPKAYRARAIAGYIIAISVASVLGGPLSTAIMTFADRLGDGGFAGLHGWQWMFILEGLPTILLGFFTLYYLTDRPANATWLTSEQRNWLEAQIAAEQRAATPAGDNTLFGALRDSRVWTLAALFGCALVGFYGLLLWLPQIVKSLGTLSDLEVGFLSAVPPLLGVVGTLLISRSSDRTGDRKFHLAGIYALGAVAMLACALTGNPVVAYILLCVAGLSLNSGNSLFWSLASSISTGAAGAVAVAAVNTIAQVGGLVGPYVIGLVRAQTGNFSIALMVVSGFLFISVVIAVLMRVTPKATAPAAG